MYSSEGSERICEEKRQIGGPAPATTSIGVSAQGRQPCRAAPASSRCSRAGPAARDDGRVIDVKLRSNAVLFAGSKLRDLLEGDSRQICMKQAQPERLTQ